MADEETLLPPPPRKKFTPKGEDDLLPPPPRKKKALDSAGTLSETSSEVSDFAAQSTSTEILKPQGGFEYSWDRPEQDKSIKTSGDVKKPKTLAEIIPSPEEITKSGKKPTVQDYVSYGSRKVVEHIADFAVEGITGTAEGLKTAKEGLKMTGLIQPTMEDFYKISKEYPDNIQLRGFVKALAGTSHAAMSILTHATPAGIAFTEGTKALESTVPKSEHVTKYLFAPITSLVEDVNGEPLAGTPKDVSAIGDLIVSMVMLHKGMEAGKALKEKYINGEPLTTAEVNDAIRSSLEVAKNPEAFQKIAEEHGFKVKDAEKIVQEQNLSEPVEGRFEPVIGAKDLTGELKSSEPKGETQVEPAAADATVNPLAAASETKTAATGEIPKTEVAKEEVSPIETKALPDVKLKPESKIISEAHDIKDVEFAKEIIDEGWFNPVGEVYEARPDFNLSTAEIKKGINDIKENKNTAAAKKMIESLKEVKESGEIPMIRGTGGKSERFGMSINEARESSKIEGETTGKSSAELLEKDRSYNLGEENVDNAIGVVSYSPNLSFVADIPKNLKKGWQKYFKKEGDLPKEVFERQVQMKGEVASLSHDLSKNISDFKKAVKTDFGGKVSSKRIVELNEALAGEKPLQELPFKTRESIVKMRAHIDQLSRKFIDEGLVEGELVGKIQKNLGTYLTRSYRALDVPDWASKVPFEVKNRATSFIRNAYEQKGQKLKEGEVEGIINELLYKFDEQTPLSILAGGKLGSKDLSVLKKRGDIAPEIRALWGEYSDVLVNYAKSVAKMSNLISRSKFLNDVKAMGMDKFLFEKPNEKHFKEIAGEGSKTMSPLNGLYTTPEIKAAFEEFSKHDPHGWLFRQYMKLNGFSKYSKTILSFPITHVRNFISNPLIMIRNGNINSNAISTAAKTIYHELAMSDNKEFRDKYKKYQELGVVGEGLNYRDVQETIKDANKTTDSFESMTDGTLQRVGRSVGKKLERLYEHEDTIYKIYSFEAEKSKYKSAFPQMSDADLNKKAAEIVRATTPTYSEVPKAIRELRQAPLVGTFVSFPYEIIRTTFNNAKLAVKELGNEKTRSIGAKRIAGTLAALTAYTAVSEFSKSVNNVSGEQDNAMRRFVAPWMKNSEFAYIENNGKGEFKILDAANSDPHNYLKKPIMAILKGESPDEAFIESISEILAPFLSEEMLAAKIIDIRRNKTQDGKQVYNEQDDFGQKYSDIFKHVSQVLEPGSITGLKKIIGGLSGQLDPKTGKPYDYQTEMINQLTGQKTHNINIPKSLSFKWAKLDNDIGEAKRIYNTMLYNKGASKSDINEAHKRASNAINKLIKEAHKDYNAALKLGVPVDEVDKILRGVRLNPQQKQAVADGSEYELPTKETQ